MASALGRGSICPHVPLLPPRGLDSSLSRLPFHDLEIQTARFSIPRPIRSRARRLLAAAGIPWRNGESLPLQNFPARDLKLQSSGNWKDCYRWREIGFLGQEIERFHGEQIERFPGGGKRNLLRCLARNAHSTSDAAARAPSTAAGNGRRRWPAPEPTRKDAARSSERFASKEGMERFFATCSPGLEEVVAAELRSPSIGASGVLIGSAGVSFRGGKEVGVRANLWLRSATRILIELASGPLPPTRTPDPVYEFVKSAADWPSLLVDGSAVGSYAAERRILQPDRSAHEEESAKFGHGGRQGANSRGSRAWKFKTFLVTSRVRDCRSVNNSMFASVRAKDAVCDAVKEACGGSRPDPPEESTGGADVPLFFSLYRDHAVLYRDMSGISLHKRGYRDVMHRAGLNEAVAAAMLTIAGWNPGVEGLESWNRGLGSNARVLMDPMCGSGTLLIEAALMAVNRAPGLMRSHWPFETWHDFHPSVLKTCRENAVAAESPARKGLRLFGNDIHEGALSLCIRDAKAAKVLSMLELSCKDCRDYKPTVSPSLVMVNPPWGARLADGSSADENDGRPLHDTWNDLGRFLKSHCSQADAYVLSGNSSITRVLHMKADKKWPLSVGGTDCRIMHYHVLPPKSSCLTLTEKIITT